MSIQYPKKKAKTNGFGETVEPFAGAVDEQTQAQVDNLNEELKKPFYPGITPVVDSESKSNEEPSQTRYTGYDDIYNMLQQAKDKSEANADNADRRARLAKAHQAVGGIYDLGRAIANLYGTTQYAPNVDLESMSDKARERYEKALAEREGYKDAAMNYMLQQNKIKNNERALDLKQAEYERKLEKDEAERVRKDNLAKAQTASYEALAAYRNSATEKNYQQAIYWQEKVKYLGLGYDDKHAESLAKQAANNALAEYRRQKASIEADGTTQETSKTNAYGQTETTVVTKKPNSGKKSNPMGENSGKRQNPMSN